MLSTVLNLQFKIVLKKINPASILLAAILALLPMFPGTVLSQEKKQAQSGKQPVNEVQDQREEPLNGRENNEPYSLPLDWLAEHDIQLIPGLKEILAGIKANAQLGEYDKINEGVTGILGAKAKLDTKNLYTISDYLILEADRATSLENFKTARVLLHGAEQISPDYCRVDFKTSSILFRESPFNILQAFSSLIKAFQKAMESRAEWNLVKANFFTLLLFACTLSFSFFFLFLFLFNLRPLFYDLQTFTPLTYAKLPSRIFSAALLLLPLAIGGVKLFLLFIPILLWGYISSHARAVIVLFFIYMAIIFPSLINGLARQTIYSNSSVYRSLERVSQGNWDHETLGSLKRELLREDINPSIYFALGYIYKKRRDYGQAILNYEKYLVSFPNDPLALSNLGATYFELEKFKTAKDYFRKAIARDPNQFEAHMNLNLTFTEFLDTQNAKMEYDKAVQLDPIRTKLFMEEHSKGESRGNIDCLLPTSRIRKYLDGLNPRIDLLYNSFWSSIMGRVSHKSYLTFLAGAALLTAIFFYFKKISGYSLVCLSCGMVFIDPLQMAQHARERCFQCTAASSRKHVFDPKMKRELQVKMANYQDKKRKLAMGLNLVFPGAGFLFGGKELMGFVCFLVNSFFLSLILMSLIKASMPWGGVTGFILANTWLIGCALVYYLIFNLCLFMLLRRN